MLRVQCKGAKVIISSLASHAKKRGCTDRAPPLLLISYIHEGAAAAAAAARVVSPLGERMGASQLGQFRARVPERGRPRPSRSDSVSGVRAVATDRSVVPRSREGEETVRFRFPFS